MSADMELQTSSSSTTKNDLNEQLREMKGNQDEHYSELNKKLREMKDSQDRMIETLKDEVRRMMIDQNNKIDILISFIDEMFTPPAQNEEPKQRHKRTQQMRQMLDMPSSQRRDILASQRQGDEVEPPQGDSF